MLAPTWDADKRRPYIPIPVGAALAPSRISDDRLTVYTLSNCDSCRRAVTWLRAHKIDFVEKAIRETPPSLAELRAMLACQNGELRRLFNTSVRMWPCASKKEILS